MITRTTNVAPAPRSRRRMTRRVFGSGWGMSGSDAGVGRGLWTVVAMDDTEHDRDEEERRDGGENEPTDHGAAERGILLAALAQAERHRQHADDHCQRRHQHGTQTHESGLERGLRRIAKLVEPLARKTDHQ